MSQDFEGDHLQFMKDMDQDMEDFIVESLSQTGAEIRKGGFTRHVLHGKTCIGTISPALVFITKLLPKPGYIGEAIDIPEQVNQEEAWRIVAGRSKFGVAVSCKGTDEAKIDKGCDHPWHAAPDSAICADIHNLFLEPILR